MFVDTHASNISYGAFHIFPIFNSFGIRANADLKLGALRIGGWDSTKTRSIYVFPYIGAGAELVFFILKSHFYTSLDMNPFQIGTLYLPDTAYHIRTLPLPELLNPITLNAYYIAHSGMFNLYAGPSFGLLYWQTPNFGINSGISYMRNGKEYIRLGMSAAYHRDDVYRYYNLFPFAFMLSVVKPIN